MEKGIRSVEIIKDESGKTKSVSVIFGPHYFIEIREKEGRTTFILGATHHGFEVDASDVGVGLEEMIYSIREKYPETAID
ncbi:MAG: hypothetical protein GYA15_10415 [Leptolinea sp.]|jgi:hypothetical protein|nr:hypothetical protein [Leptolinea sp.]